MQENSMKAIEIADGALRLCARPVPRPEAGQVLIRVAAAGINRPDLMQRAGKYPPPPGASDLPGLEVAGTIAASAAPEWKEGDAVCALLAGGGYAEYATAPAGQCLPIPAGLTTVEAAALPETVFTVWNNLFVRGRLRAGETALIHGGASGIGTMAIQMAVAFGATPLVTAGTEEKCAACRALGAALAVNYREADFVAAVLEYTKGNGADAVLDMVGGDYLPRNLDCLAPDGRHISIATQRGGRAELDIVKIMQKRLTLTGSTLRPRPVAEKAALAQGLREQVWPLIEAGRIRPLIHKTFPLAQAQAAHELMESGEHTGKVVLIV
jgi:NADPH2:quinone reductase